jgi:hypothetical protein
MWFSPSGPEEAGAGQEAWHQYSLLHRSLATAAAAAAATTHLAQHGKVGGQGEGQQVALQGQAHALGGWVNKQDARPQPLVGAA